jgi:cell division protein FtsW
MSLPWRHRGVPALWAGRPPRGQAWGDKGPQSGGGAALRGFDQALLWVTVALLAFGLVMVYSASIALPDNPKFARYAHTHFLVRHALFLAIAFFWRGHHAFQVPLSQPGKRWRPGCSCSSLLLLVVVLIPASARASTARAAGSGWAS